MNVKVIRNIIIAVLIIAVSLFVKGKLSGMATKAEIKESKTAPIVNTFTFSSGTVPLPLELYGKLNAVNRVDLLAEVSGSFVGGDRQFLEGVAFQKGEVLIALDNLEATANVMSLKGNFINAVVGILPDIKMDYAASYPDFESFLNDLSLSKPLPTLPQTSGTLEKFLIARGIQSAYYQVKSAEERLQKFSIRAPFNGVVAAANVKRGNLVSPGRALGTFVGTGAYEVKSAVTLAYADELSVGQSVRFTSPDIEGNWTGRIDRISPIVDGASQSINVIATVQGKELREGMYLTGTIEGLTVENAMRVPSYVVFDNEYVYTVENDSVLQKQKIHVVEWLDDSIIITGIEEGTKLVDSPTLKAAAGTIVNAIGNNR